MARASPRRSDDQYEVVPASLARPQMALSGTPTGTPPHSGNAYCGRAAHGTPSPIGIPQTTASSGAMTPTWQGFVHTTGDALLVLEGTCQGRLNHIPRRPHDRERHQIITSGNVFIYEENASGIKRWTDGVTWSPSRIMGNFLVYRELSEPFPAGEKKKARKRKRGTEDGNTLPVTTPHCEEDRKLVGSLVDSYGFKPNGLIKKTLNVRFNNVNHHIVSYYNLEDVKSGKLQRPRFDPRISHLMPRQDFMQNNWKVPPYDPEEDGMNIDPFSNQMVHAPQAFPDHFAHIGHMNMYPTHPMTSTPEHTQFIGQVLGSMTPSPTSAPSIEYFPQALGYVNTPPQFHDPNMVVSVTPIPRVPRNDSVFSQHQQPQFKSEFENGVEIPNYVTTAPPATSAPAMSFSPSFDAGAMYIGAPVPQTQHHGLDMAEFPFEDLAAPSAKRRQTHSSTQAHSVSHSMQDLHGSFMSQDYVSDDSQSPIAHVPLHSNAHFNY